MRLNLYCKKSINKSIQEGFSHGFLRDSLIVLSCSASAKRRSPKSCTVHVSSVEIMWKTVGQACQRKGRARSLVGESPLFPNETAKGQLVKMQLLTFIWLFFPPFLLLFFFFICHLFSFSHGWTALWHGARVSVMLWIFCPWWGASHQIPPEPACILERQVCQEQAPSIHFLF